MSRRSARLNRSSTDSVLAADENFPALANQKTDEVQRLSLASKRSTLNSSIESTSESGFTLEDIENNVAINDTESRNKSNSPRPSAKGGQDNQSEDLTPEKEKHRESSVWQEVATPGTTRNTPKRRSSAVVWKEVATPVPDELPVGVDQDTAEATVQVDSITKAVDALGLSEEEILAAEEEEEDLRDDNARVSALTDPDFDEPADWTSRE